MNKPKTIENEEGFDDKSHQILVNELLENIFEGRDANYQMNQQQFLKLLVE